MHFGFRRKHVPLSSFRRELLNAFRLAVSSDFRRFDSLSSSFYITEKHFYLSSVEHWHSMAQYYVNYVIIRHQTQ
jgi:hypothetical protein